MNLDPPREDNNTHLKSPSNIRQGELGYEQVNIKYFRDEENKGH